MPRQSYPATLLALIQSTTYPPVPGLEELELLRQALTEQTSSGPVHAGSASGENRKDKRKHDDVERERDKERNRDRERDREREKVALEANEKSGARLEAIERARVGGAGGAQSHGAKGGPGPGSGAGSGGQGSKVKRERMSRKCLAFFGPAYKHLAKCKVRPLVLISSLACTFECFVSFL